MADYLKKNPCTLTGKESIEDVFKMLSLQETINKNKKIKVNSQKISNKCLSADMGFLPSYDACKSIALNRDIKKEILSCKLDKKFEAKFKIAKFSRPDYCQFCNTNVNEKCNGC